MPPFRPWARERSARVVELWSARTAALGSRHDVAYVLVFENRGRMIGSTIEHPHSQIMAFGMIPPIPAAELSASKCHLCPDPDDDLLVTRRAGWQAAVPWAPSWPYELLISPRSHVADLPAAGPELRNGLAVMLVDALTRLDRLLGPGAPYMLWVHQRPNDGADWPAAHLHLHLAPALRAPACAGTWPPPSSGPACSSTRSIRGRPRPEWRSSPNALNRDAGAWFASRTAGSRKASGSRPAGST